MWVIQWPSGRTVTSWVWGLCPLCSPLSDLCLREDFIHSKYSISIGSTKEWMRKYAIWRGVVNGTAFLQNLPRLIKTTGCYPHKKVKRDGNTPQPWSPVFTPLPRPQGLLSKSLEKFFNFFQVKGIRIEDYDFEKENYHSPLFSVFEYLENYDGKLEFTVVGNIHTNVP